jgi:hypothetical protein
MLRTIGTALVAISLWGTPALAQDMTGEVMDLDWVGFQQFQESSRVFIRTTEPVQFNIDTSQPGMVVVTLANTRIPVRNNRRPLDTRFFSSPVSYIHPKVIEGPSSTVRIEIHLRQRVPFQQVQTDNVLSLYFQRIME